MDSRIKSALSTEMEISIVESADFFFVVSKLFSDVGSVSFYGDIAVNATAIRRMMQQNNHLDFAFASPGIKKNGAGNTMNWFTQLLAGKFV